MQTIGKFFRFLFIGAIVAAIVTGIIYLNVECFNGNIGACWIISG